MCHWAEEEVSQNECKYISIDVSCNKVQKNRQSSISNSERIQEIANSNFLITNMSKKCDETCIVIRTIVIRISSFCPTMTYRISCYCNIVGVAHYSTNTFIYIEYNIIFYFVSNQIDSCLKTIYKLYIVVRKLWYTYLNQNQFYEIIFLL